MYFPKLIEVCINNKNNLIVSYVGIFDGKLLFSQEGGKYLFLSPEEVSNTDDIEQSLDTQGIPIFPKRDFGDEMTLPNGNIVNIIGIAPMLPPHSTVFEYMVMDEQGNIFTITEPGYIQDSFLFKD